MYDRDHVLTLRLSGADWLALNELASHLGCSRAEAARSALREGVRFATAGHTFNITRAVLLLEYTQAAVDVIISRDHGDFGPELLEAAKQRLATYHSS